MTLLSSPNGPNEMSSTFLHTSSTTRTNFRRSHVLNQKYDTSDPIIREIMADTSEQSTCPDFKISRIDCESDSDVSSIGDSDDVDFKFLSLPKNVKTKKSRRLLKHGMRNDSHFPFNQDISIFPTNKKFSNMHQGFCLEPKINPLPSPTKKGKRNKPFCMKRKGENLATISPSKSYDIRQQRSDDIYISYNFRPQECADI